VRAVCDGLERCCSVSMVCNICEIVREMRHSLGTFEPLKLICVFAGRRMCDFDVIWGLMVLGVQHRGAGARAFWGKGDGAIFVGRGCDVVLTPCDLRRLEMAPLARIGSLLLLCLG